MWTGQPDSEPGERPPESTRRKVVVLVVATVVVVSTIVLCCMAIRTAAGLFDIDPRLR